MLKCAQQYVDEGVRAYEGRFEQRRLRSITTTARSMGYQLVTIEDGG